MLVNFRRSNPLIQAAREASGEMPSYFFSSKAYCLGIFVQIVAGSGRPDGVLLGSTLIVNGNCQIRQVRREVTFVIGQSWSFKTSGLWCNLRGCDRRVLRPPPKPTGISWHGVRSKCRTRSVCGVSTGRQSVP